MPSSFSQRDCTILGIVMGVEIVLFFVYVIVASIQLRKKVISMGRLIGMLPVIIVGTQQPIVAQPLGYQPPGFGNVPPPSYYPDTRAQEPVQYNAISESKRF